MNCCAGGRRGRPEISARSTTHSPIIWDDPAAKTEPKTKKTPAKTQLPNKDPPAKTEPPQEGIDSSHGKAIATPAPRRKVRRETGVWVDAGWRLVGRHGSVIDLARQDMRRGRRDVGRARLPALARLRDRCSQHFTLGSNLG